MYASSSIRQCAMFRTTSSGSMTRVTGRWKKADRPETSSRKSRSAAPYRPCSISRTPSALRYPCGHHGLATMRSSTSRASSPLAAASTLPCSFPSECRTASRRARERSTIAVAAAHSGSVGTIRSGSAALCSSTTACAASRRTAADRVWTRIATRRRHPGARPAGAPGVSPSFAATAASAAPSTSIAAAGAAAAAAAPANRTMSATSARSPSSSSPTSPLSNMSATLAKWASTARASASADGRSPPQRERRSRSAAASRWSAR
mmetsp:Transcript_14800/g.43823  ORF Transcript_14800/g.43823 Transcript_14800/m.43823 type:complete len:263 (-) Transcript_14800:9-797(-)